MRRAAAVLVALLGIVACRGSARPAATPAPLKAPAHTSERAYVDTNISRVFEYGRRNGSTRAQLTRGLGAPRSVRSDTTPNRHGYGTDSIFRLDYGGIVYWVRRAGNNGPDLLEHAELLDGRRVLGVSVVVQQTTSKQLFAWLGMPPEREIRGDTVMVTYKAPGDGADEFVRFDLVRGIVRRIVWIFYVN